MLGTTFANPHPDPHPDPHPAGEGIEPKWLRYSYYTAGSGGAGPTILETSFLLAGEEVGGLSRVGGGACALDRGVLLPYSGPYNTPAWQWRMESYGVGRRGKRWAHHPGDHLSCWRARGCEGRWEDAELVLPDHGYCALLRASGWLSMVRWH